MHGVQSICQKGASFGGGLSCRRWGIHVLFYQRLRLRLHTAFLRWDPKLFQRDFLAVWLSKKGNKAQATLNIMEMKAMRLFIVQTNNYTPYLLVFGLKCFFSLLNVFLKTLSYFTLHKCCSETERNVTSPPARKCKTVPTCQFI